MCSYSKGPGRLETPGALTEVNRRVNASSSIPVLEPGTTPWPITDKVNALIRTRRARARSKEQGARARSKEQEQEQGARARGVSFV